MLPRELPLLPQKVEIVLPPKRRRRARLLRRGRRLMKEPLFSGRLGKPMLLRKRLGPNSLRLLNVLLGLKVNWVNCVF